MIDPTKFDSEVEQHDPTKKQKTGNTDELKKQLLTALIVLITNILFTATVYAQPTVWGSASPGVIEAQFGLNPTPTSGFLDYGKPILFRQLVGYSSILEPQVGLSMGAASNSINACSIPYLLIINNSNSYAFQAG